MAYTVKFDLPRRELGLHCVKLDGGHVWMANRCVMSVATPQPMAPKTSLARGRHLAPILAVCYAILELIARPPSERCRTAENGTPSRGGVNKSGKVELAP